MVASPDPLRPDGVQYARRRAAVGGNALGVASMMLWACGFPAADYLLQTWAPLSLITVRFALAVLALVVIWAALEGPAAVVRARWGRGVLLGSVTFGLGAWLFLVAQALTDAVTVAIIAAATPVAATVIEVVTGQRRVRRQFLIGLVLSVIGGVVAVGAGGISVIGLGPLAAVGSVFLFALGSHWTVEHLGGLSQIGRATVTLGGGFLFTGSALAVALGFGLVAMPSLAMDSTGLSMMLIYAVAGMALSQVMWIASVGRLGIAVASFHINVAPFYVMLLMLVWGGVWNWTQALAAAVVILGVVVAQSRDA